VTLTVAQWYAARARKLADLEPAMKLLQWAADRALPSGVLPEQVDPYTGRPISVAPLTWSHASYVLAVHRIADKIKLLTKKERSGIDRRATAEEVAS
jgi:GH15 family glucan-1,4-alpha-glucosidase